MQWRVTTIIIFLIRQTYPKTFTQSHTTISKATESPKALMLLSLSLSLPAFIYTHSRFSRNSPSPQFLFSTCPPPSDLSSWATYTCQPRRIYEVPTSLSCHFLTLFPLHDNPRPCSVINGYYLIGLRLLPRAQCIRTHILSKNFSYQNRVWVNCSFVVWDLETRARILVQWRVRLVSHPRER